jgi:hypothetical protein
MKDADRFRLLGTYTTPRVNRGTVLSCECRDCDVIVAGYSEAPIPWPIGRQKGSSAREFAVRVGLADVNQVLNIQSDPNVWESARGESE